MNKNYISSFLVILISILTLTPITTADEIGYLTAGSSSNTIGNEGATNVYGSRYTSVSGGTFSTAYINGHNNWNGVDTVVILVYDDTGGYPYRLIGESDEIEINTSSYQWWNASISGTITASTDYWIFVRNVTVSSATVRIHNDGNIINGYRTSDTSPTNDPFVDGATVNNNSEYSIYISYTSGGGSSQNTKLNRRRKMLLLGDKNEEDILCSHVSTFNK